jgi:hypothetical protein
LGTVRGKTDNRKLRLGHSQPLKKRQERKMAFARIYYSAHHVLELRDEFDACSLLPNLPFPSSTFSQGLDSCGTHSAHRNPFANVQPKPAETSDGYASFLA